ncbi:multiple sugar transport system substrate-binding protein [Paenarthrobacter nicotinovorans]|uniref:ABC transporter substrate-binding protein n=1 Tax=Paenarthrobacter nicotinovorans TaxID=29320 RepID=UPI00277D2797|nr:extracellular solute-binding protein [Paenarthrobacter nicotinovorans]MDP9933746.1 multiple sugar transport system substrate-binding protein [Paenarthrobacter nicotinovorans]
MTKKYTRALTSIAALAVGAFALTACTGGATSDPTGKVEGDISYGFWGNPARGEKVAAVTNQFSARFPNVTVKAEIADYLAYIERLTVRAAGNELPCATGMQSTILAQYASKEVLRPLDDLIKSGQIDVSGIPQDVLASGQVDGKQYMIPTGTFVRLMAYNADMVTAAGIKPPTDDMTWEDYAKWLTDVQSKLPSGVYAGEDNGGLLFTLSSWVAGHGGEVFTQDNKLGFDKRMLADYFTYWLDLARKGAIVPPAKIPEQNGALELTPMALGTAVSGTRDIPHIYITQQALAKAGRPSTVKSVSVPSEDANRSANIVGSNGISIPESCDNVPTAAAWINFFSNDVEAALAFQSDNGILTNTKAQEALVADAKTPAGVKQNVTIFRQLTDSGDLTTARYPAGLNTVTNELLRLYQAAAFGQMSVDEAVDAFFASAENALD